MAQTPPLNINLPTINRSESNLSISSDRTSNPSRSEPTSFRGSPPNQRRIGILGKIETGLRSILRRFSRPRTSLTEMEIQMLLTNTDFTREEVLQWHAQFISDYPNGFMTRKQFVSMYKSLNPKGDVERYARHVFRVFDLDKSKTVDFREFLLSLSMTSNKSPIETKLEWAFHVFDIDGNGVLTRPECLEVIDAIIRFNVSLQSETHGANTERVIQAARKSMMKMFDNVGDHQTNRLTQEQFVQGCLNDQLISQLLTPTANSTLTNTQDVNNHNLITS